MIIHACVYIHNICTCNTFTPHIKASSHATYVYHVVLSRCATTSKVWYNFQWNVVQLSIGMQIILLSLSTVVLNSRDRYENVWLPKNMHLEKQPFKNHHVKNQLQLYWYNTNNTITSFKVAKCC